MKNEEIVNEVITALEKRNWENVEKKLTDNFTFSGAVPKPISKKEWVGVQRAIQSGIPDLKFNLRQVTTKGDKVVAKVQLSGTHSADMPAPIPGAKAYPSTGKKIQMPEEEIEFTIVGDKISNLNVKPTPHGGVPGLLEQIEKAQKA